MLIDDVPHYSCSVLTHTTRGKRVQTIEGLADPVTGKLSAVQQGVIDEQGFQCAFCMPGFVMATTGYLKTNPNPTRQELVARRLRQSVPLSGLRQDSDRADEGRRTHEERVMADNKLIGQDYTTPDLVAKVTGKAKYAEDYRVEGMLFAKLLVSPHPHARVSRLDTSAALAMPGVKAILTADDMPGAAVGATLGEGVQASAQAERGLTNEPLYQGEPILAVAAIDELTAALAIEAIVIEFEPLPFVVDPIESLRPGAANARMQGNVWMRPTAPPAAPGARGPANSAAGAAAAAGAPRLSAGAPPAAGAAIGAQSRRGCGRTRWRGACGRRSARRSGCGTSRGRRGSSRRSDRRGTRTRRTRRGRRCPRAAADRGLEMDRRGLLQSRPEPDADGQGDRRVGLRQRRRRLQEGRPRHRRNVHDAVDRPPAARNADGDGVLRQNGKLFLHGSTQSTVQTVAAVARWTGLTPDKVVIISEYTGGGFGSKIPGAISMAIPALLSKKANAPVMMRITREDEHFIGRARPGILARVKIGFTKEGRITAVDMYAICDNGPYDAQGDGRSAGTTMSLAYQPETMRWRGLTVLTNTPPKTSQRAPGGMQGIGLFEPMLSKAAKQLGLDQVAVRRIRMRPPATPRSAPRCPTASRRCVTKSAFGSRRRSTRATSCSSGTWKKASYSVQEASGRSRAAHRRGGQPVLRQAARSASTVCFIIKPDGRITFQSGHRQPRHALGVRRPPAGGGNAPASRGRSATSSSAAPGRTCRGPRFRPAARPRTR